MSSVQCGLARLDAVSHLCVCILSNQAIHPREYTFASGGGDNIKKWALPDGDFMKNLSGTLQYCFHNCNEKHALKS